MPAAGMQKWGLSEDGSLQRAGSGKIAEEDVKTERSQSAQLRPSSAVTSQPGAHSAGQDEGTPFA